MIRLPRFELLCPTTTAGIIEAFSASGEETKLIAGGTDLIVNIKRGLFHPRRLVWLGKVEELRKITCSSERGICVGAMCTLSDIASSPIIQRHMPALSDAASAVGSPAIRNSATIGGNLCQEPRCCYYNQSESWRGALGGCLKAGVASAPDSSLCHAAPGWSECSAVFCSDIAPLLVAVDASVTLLGPNGERSIKLAAFYRDDGMNHLTLRSGEVLASVTIPTPLSSTRAVYRKIRDRRSIDFALANVGIAVTCDSEGVCSNATIVVGAIQSAPIVVLDASRALIGAKISAEQIGHAAERAAETVRPVPNVDEPVGYRKRMVKVLVKRALTELAAGIGE